MTTQADVVREKLYATFRNLPGFAGKWKDTGVAWTDPAYFSSGKFLMRVEIHDKMCEGIPPVYRLSLDYGNRHHMETIFSSDLDAISKWVEDWNEKLLMHAAHLE